MERAVTSMRQSIAAFAAIVRRSPVRFLAIAFVVTNAVGWQEGGVNPASRFAALAAMSESHTFRIDSYRDWTCDWARTPDGAYYSNKAPGPMFLAFPLTFVLGAGSVAHPPSLFYRTLVALLLQVLPYVLLVILCIELLACAGVSVAGQIFAGVAALFGNTATVFLNTFFGHGLAAVFFLGLLLALVKRRYFWIGACAGWALLCDYGVAAMLPGLAVAGIATWQLESSGKGRALAAAALGALLPGVLWVWYHTVCFGSPWSLPFKFQNPAFVSGGAGSSGAGGHAGIQLWGLFELLPPPSIAWALLAGNKRGLLFTQPWLLLVLGGVVAALFRRWRARRRLASGTSDTGQPSWFPAVAALAVLGLFGVFWMNAGFDGWHGGGSAGPRYMCMVFPLFAILGGLVYDRWPRWGRSLLWATVAIAVLLRALIFAGDLRAVYTRSIWGVYLRNLGAATWPSAWLHLLFFAAVVGWACIKSRPQQTPARLDSSPVSG